MLFPCSQFLADPDLPTPPGVPTCGSSAFLVITSRKGTKTSCRALRVLPHFSRAGVREYEADHCPWIRPAIRALKYKGGGIGGVPLDSHDVMFCRKHKEHFWVWHKKTLAGRKWRKKSLDVFFSSRKDPSKRCMWGLSFYSFFWLKRWPKLWRKIAPIPKGLIACSKSCGW